MIYPVYAIRDRLVGFGQLLIENNVEIAKRHFAEAVKAGSFKTPEDYDLYEIGSYDVQSGKFLSVDLPVFVCAATDYV